MTELAIRLNAQYFAGTRTAPQEDGDWLLWENHLPDSFYALYLKSILTEPARAMNRYALCATNDHC